MIVVDTSGWLEYFTDGRNAAKFEDVILKNADKIIVPAVIIYEVFKKILIEKGENTAIQVIGQLKRYRSVDIDENMALMAAKFSKKYKLAMADSLIYAAAVKHRAELYTMDADFKELKGVVYIKK